MFGFGRRGVEPFKTINISLSPINKYIPNNSFSFFLFRSEKSLKFIFMFLSYMDLSVGTVGQLQIRMGLIALLSISDWYNNTTIHLEYRLYIVLMAVHMIKLKAT